MDHILSWANAKRPPCPLQPYLPDSTARGVKLGGARREAKVRHEAVAAKSQANAERVRTILSNSRAGGMTYKAIAEEFNKLGVSTATQKGKWYDTTVRRYALKIGI